MFTLAIIAIVLSADTRYYSENQSAASSVSLEKRCGSTDTDSLGKRCGSSSEKRCGSTGLNTYLFSHGFVYLTIIICILTLPQIPKIKYVSGLGGDELCNDYCVTVFWIIVVYLLIYFIFPLCFLIAGGSVLFADDMCVNENLMIYSYTISIWILSFPFFIVKFLWLFSINWY
jgi:hypothetical protein